MYSEFYVSVIKVASIQTTVLFFTPQWASSQALPTHSQKKTTESVTKSEWGAMSCSEDCWFQWSHIIVVILLKWDNCRTILSIRVIIYRNKYLAEAKVTKRVGIFGLPWLSSCISINLCTNAERTNYILNDKYSNQLILFPGHVSPFKFQSPKVRLVKKNIHLCSILFKIILIFQDCTDAGKRSMLTCWDSILCNQRQFGVRHSFYPPEITL